MEQRKNISLFWTCVSLMLFLASCTPSAKKDNSRTFAGMTAPTSSVQSPIDETLSSDESNELAHKSESSDPPVWINGVNLVCNKGTVRGEETEIGCMFVRKDNGQPITSFPDGISIAFVVTDDNGVPYSMIFQPSTGIFQAEVPNAKVDLLTIAYEVSQASSNTKAQASISIADAIQGAESLDTSVIAIDTTPPSLPSNLNHEGRAASLTTMPPTTWTTVSDSDLSHFEVSIGTSPGATNTLAWTNVARATAYSHSSLTLVDNEIYYFNLRSVDTAGNVSAVLSSSGWQNLICPTGYIKIPGNETPGLGGAVYTFGSKTRYDGTQRKLSDFCVMKYEAKFQNNGVIKADGNGVFADQVNLANAGAVANVIPVSAPEGKPWSRISREDLTKQMDAPRACAKLGADYSLINNAQWQTIARDVEATVSNWKEGTTAGTNDNALNRGHSDDAAKGTLAASNDDSLACLGIGTSTADLNPIADNCNNSWHNNKRTFALSTGDVIWDFSGNIYEWILDLNSQVWGSSDYIITNPFASSAGKLAWGPAGDHTQKDGDDKGGLGHFYDGIADTTTAVFRGVGFSSTTKGGLFYSHTSQLLDHISPGRGFRCVYAP